MTAAPALPVERPERGVSTLFVLPPVLALVAFVGFAALLYRQRDLAVVCVLLVAFGGGVQVWARRAHRRLAFSCTVDRERLFPDETFAFRVEAANRKLLPVWLNVRPVLPPSLDRPAGPESEREAGLLGHQQVRFYWERTPRSRGVYRLGPAYAFAGDLFGFLSSRRRIDETRELLVYPRLVDLTGFTLPRRDFFGLAAARGPVEDPVLILGTREYAQGRPAKRIHWKASARHGRLQEKVLEATFQEKALLAVDVASFAAAGASGDFEEALEAVASLATRFHRLGFPLGLAVNGCLEGADSGLVPVRRSYGQLEAVLEVLARLRMEPREPLTAVAASAVRSGSVSCLLFSYREDEGTAAFAAQCARRRAPLTHFVCEATVEPASPRVRVLSELRLGAEARC